MCEFVEENKCKLNCLPCPWVYWCDKVQGWRENKYMPKDCKMKKSVQHKGKYKVRNFRKGFLYVDIEDNTYKIENPFDFIPDYVDVQKRNGIYRIKK